MVNFYAGRTAISPTKTLMFGLAAHKNTRSNIGNADFGDLAIHKVSMTTFHFINTFITLNTMKAYRLTVTATLKHINTR